MPEFYSPRLYSWLSSLLKVSLLPYIMYSKNHAVPIKRIHKHGQINYLYQILHRHINLLIIKLG